MSPSEFRAGLAWMLGLPCIDEGTLCRHCGAQSDTQGLHVTKCTWSGAPSNGHSVVKETMRAICKDDNIEALKEKGLPGHPELIPADLLFPHLLPKGPRALDFTVWSRPADGAGPLDLARQHKDNKYLKGCQEAGWSFSVWAADTNGCLHPQAVSFTKAIIRLMKDSSNFANDSEVDVKVCNALSTAVVLRAATPLARHSKQRFRGNADET